MIDTFASFYIQHNTEQAQSVCVCVCGQWLELSCRSWRYQIPPTPTHTLHLSQFQAPSIGSTQILASSFSICFYERRSFAALPVAICHSPIANHSTGLDSIGNCRPKPMELKLGFGEAGRASDSRLASQLAAHAMDSLARPCWSYCLT